MDLTLRQLNRATLARQGLLARRKVDAATAVRDAVALQAQEPPSPYVALWNRIHRFDPARLDAALVAGEVVKATLIRITQHLVHADDYTAVHAAMVANLRASRLHDRRYTSTGRTVADADRVLPALLAFCATPRETAEIEAHLAEMFGGDPGPRLWWALRTFAPLAHVPGDAPWAFNADRTYRAGPTIPERPSPEAAMEHLLWRYLEGFGPATPQDFGQFALQRKPAVSAALHGLRDRLVVHRGPDGRELFDVPHGRIPTGDEPAPARLLGMWDNVHLAYVDRRRSMPDEYRSHVIRRNGDVLPTAMVDGEVIGVWRTNGNGIEVHAFRPISSTAWEDLAAEAAALAPFLAARDARVYRRYDHWWASLPAGEARLLPG